MESVCVSKQTNTMLEPSPTPSPLEWFGQREATPTASGQRERKHAATIRYTLPNRYIPVKIFNFSMSILANGMKAEHQGCTYFKPISGLNLISVHYLQ